MGYCAVGNTGLGALRMEGRPHPAIMPNLRVEPKVRTKGVPNRHAMHTRMELTGRSAYMVYLHPTKGWRRRFLAGF